MINDPLPAVPEVRTGGQTPTKLTKQEYLKRWRQNFYDPAFAKCDLELPRPITGVDVSHLAEMGRSTWDYDRDAGALVLGAEHVQADDGSVGLRRCWKSGSNFHPW